ncbi:MAG: hypothetical protein ACOCZE_07185 [Planctomycetota bacterium]
MRINNIYGFQPQGVGKKDDAGKTGKPSKADAKGQVEKTDPESLVISEAEPYLSKIQALPDVRTDAVEAAKQALANGELDNPQAVRKAAETILDQGL